jgi:hypothetical protein
MEPPQHKHARLTHLQRCGADKELSIVQPPIRKTEVTQYFLRQASAHIWAWEEPWRDMMMELPTSLPQ